MYGGDAATSISNRRPSAASAASIWSSREPWFRSSLRSTAESASLRRRITVGGEVAVFERVRNLRFINRFGEEVVRQRRCCRYRDQPGAWRRWM